MKIMVCRDLGGPCEEKLKAESWNEMVNTMVAHVMKNHPDTAKEMKRMHNDDPKKWGKEMKPKWEATLED